MTDNAAEQEVIIRREGRAGRITLNRPRAINALSYPMIAPMVAALKAWKDDAGVALVILDGAGDRGLCAGGDVISLYNSRASEGSALARQFWSDEYKLNALIGSYPKPIVAIQDGIVMGGGIGLSGHASHRIVTERSMLAMPETTIGLIPDVGGTWLLAHAPGQIGVYLGLTGHRMNAADAIYAGFADTCVEVKRLDELKRVLAETDDPVSVAIAQCASAPPAGTLAQHREAIDALFAGGTMEEIVAALTAAETELSARMLKELASRSPLACKATLASVRGAKKLRSLEEALEIEYRLTVRLFEHGEFPEGIRALLVDKDRKPKWNPPTLAEVNPAMMDALFAPMPQGEAWSAR